MKQIITDLKDERQAICYVPCIKDTDKKTYYLKKIVHGYHDQEPTLFWHYMTPDYPYGGIIYNHVKLSHMIEKQAALTADDKALFNDSLVFFLERMGQHPMACFYTVSYGTPHHSIEKKFYDVDYTQAAFNISHDMVTLPSDVNIEYNGKTHYSPTAQPVIFHSLLIP